MLINCDMGEALSPNPDPEVIAFIDLANIACGGHAGNQHSMQTTLELAKQHQVAVGAHPSYPDLVNFGRKSMDLAWLELKASLTQQVQQLESLAQQSNQNLHHIKPHGALYLDMMKNPELFDHLLRWMAEIVPNIPLMLLGGVDNEVFLTKAEKLGVPLLFEAFADRAYLANGHLAPRSQANSLFTDPEQIVQQTCDFIQQNKADSLCFHSDNPASVEALKLLNS